MVAVGFNKETNLPPLQDENMFISSSSQQPSNNSPTQELNGVNITHNEIVERRVANSEIDIKNNPFNFLEPPIKKDKPVKKVDNIQKLEFNNQPKPHQMEVPRASLPIMTTELPTKDSEELNFDDSFLSKLSDLKDGILNENRNSIGFGMFYKTRVGSSGLDALDVFTLPAIDGHYFIGLSHHLYGFINILNMSNGSLADDAISRYGASDGGNVGSVDSLVENLVGYEYKTESAIFTAEIGTVPSPAVSPEVDYIWKLEYVNKSGKVTFNIAYVNKSVKDSLLSRIGDQYYYRKQDNLDTEDQNESLEYGTAVRGGVTKEGIEIGFKHANPDDIFAGNLNYYYDVKGFNVPQNKEIALALLYLRVLHLKEFQSFMIGPIFLYDSYSYNSSYFSVGEDGDGNGGYFSPKNFFLLGIYFDMAQIYSDRLFWKVKGNVGVTNFLNGKDIFDSRSKEGTVSGFGYEVKAFAGYKIDDSIQLLAGIGYQSSGPFKSLFFGLTAIYYFGEKKNNKVDDLLYSNTLGEMVK